MNANPKFNKIDVNIVTKKIDVNLPAPWNPKTDARVVHVDCASGKADQLNKALYSLYNKKRKWMNAASNLPEGNSSSMSFSV